MAAKNRDSISKSTVRRCTEDHSACIPVDKYCNRLVDCPLGTDEKDCSCADLDMHECMINGARLCIFDEWIKDMEINIPLCENRILQFKERQIVKWKYQQELDIQTPGCPLIKSRNADL